MIDLDKLFDSYSRQARLYPALLCASPLFFITVVLAPKIIEKPSFKLLISLAITMGGLYLLSEIARSAGKKIEPGLIDSWGGWPTTVMLRHSDTTLPLPTKARYHGFLSAQLPGLQMPSAQFEAADQRSADAIYSSGVQWIREKTRGTDFGLLLKENASYGFRRNMLGLKPVAILLSVGTMATAVLLGRSEKFPEWPNTIHNLTQWMIHSIRWEGQIAALFAGAVCVTWLVVVRPSWVKEAADDYAKALLGSCDRLAAANPQP